MSIGKPEQKGIANNDNFLNLVFCFIWHGNLGVYYFCTYKYLFAILECRKMNPIKSLFWHILQREIANRKAKKC
jgi:hypothetical protein